ncbi:MAG: M28 family peptidase [Kiritimatiellia bacterium]
MKTGTSIGVFLVGSLGWLASLAAGQADPWLARIDVRGPPTSIPLLVYAQGQDAAGQEYVLVKASAAALDGSGLTVQALDGDAASAAYILAREFRAGARAAAQNRFRVVHDDGRRLVVRVVSGDELDALADLGFQCRFLPATPMDFAPSPARARAGVPRMVAVASNAAVAAMMAQVTQTNLEENLRGLTGLQPVLAGGTYTNIRTRHQSSGVPLQRATALAYERFTALGLQTSYRGWTNGGMVNRNVVGVRPGTTAPAQIVVVCAHIDDMPATGDAPGADDNASGSVAVFAAAEIMATRSFERTLRFVIFTGEEQGLLGSERYAQAAQAAGDDVVAVLNLDMLGWDGNGDNRLKLYVRPASDPGHAGDRDIAATFTNVVRTYGLRSGLAPEIAAEVSDWSDHYSFQSRGYPAICAIEEDVDDFNPYYHTANDTLARLNLPYYTRFVKAVVGTAAHLAQPRSLVPALAVAPANRAHSAAAAVGQTLAVTANVPWSAASGAAWIAITGGGSGATNGTVTYAVATNAGLFARTGTIAVAGGGITRTFTATQAGSPPALGNVIVGLAVPGQVGATMANLIYGGRLTAPIYTFHVPYGTSLASLAPTLTLAPGATASPASGTARNFTAPRLAYAVTYGGQTRTNFVQAVVLPPAAATSGTSFAIGSPALRDVWVDPVNGSDTIGDGSTRARAYRTIDRAWADVPAHARFATTGYRLMLCPGTYANDRTWMEHRYGTYDRPLVFQAADGPGTAIVANDMQFFSCHFVYLRDLVFAPTNGGDGLHLDSCEFVLLKNCVIRGGPGTQRLAQEGLKANQCEYLYVEDCEIANASENALDYMCCHYGHIRRSRLHDAGDWVAYVKGGSSDFLIEGNEFYNGGTGGFVAGQGAGSEFLTAPWIHYQASNVRFVNNVVRDCEGAGFGVNGARNVLFAYNTLYRVGSRSHGIEVAFGNNSLDGAAEAPIAQTYLQWGGWTHASTSGDQRIPNRNVYVYNNVLYNPMPFRSAWQHFEFTGPWADNTNPHIPKPARTDSNLQIKGNVLWNGPPDLELGIWADTACQPDNPTCNATLLAAENHINQFAPQLVDPAGGDFRPVAGGNVFQATTYAIPPFPSEAPLAPPEPVGDRTNAVPLDRDGNRREASSPPGAYAGVGMELSVAPASRNYAAAGAVGQQLAVAANGPWTATSSAPWLAISAGASGTGAGAVTFAAAPNAGAARTATITVAGSGATGTFTACQWPASPFAGLAADGDYDGDGAADVAIYNPATGTWLLALTTGAHWRFAWGGSSFMPVPADYNGDGLLDFALYQRSTGTWFIQDSGGSSRKVQFGWGRTVPVPGDYDGDGRADLALFNPDSARWYVQGTTAGSYSAQWGWAGIPVVPVPGDYDGDGATDLAIYHPASGQWFVLQSGSGLMLRKTWGSAAMAPVPADYDGDGKTDVAAFKRATGQWYLALSGGGSRTATLGWASTVPVPADYDGDGRADVAVYNRDSGIWYVVESATGVLARRTWGWRGTLPAHPLPWIHAWFGLP